MHLSWSRTVRTPTSPPGEIRGGLRISGPEIMPRKPKPKRRPANSPKRGRGRPTDYRPELCEAVEKLAKLGLTDEEMADVIGKPIGTFNRWKADHEEFREAIKRGKIPADAEVASRMFERAKGYEWDEQQPVKLKVITYGENGKKTSETERVEIVTVRRVVPPDTMAGMYWLNNRQKDRWRQRHELAGPNGKPLFADLNLDEVREGVQGKLDRIVATARATAMAVDTKR